VREAELLTDMQAIVLGLDLDNRGFLEYGCSQSAIINLYHFLLAFFSFFYQYFRFVCR
jgi:hypothetical protein